MTSLSSSFMFHQSEHELSYNFGDLKLRLSQKKSVKMSEDGLEVTYTRWINDKKITVKEVTFKGQKSQRSVHTQMNQQEFEEFKRIWKLKWKPEFKDNQDEEKCKKLIQQSNQEMNNK